MTLRWWFDFCQSRYGRPSTMGLWRPRGGGIAVAATALVLAAGAVVISGLALVHTVEPAQHSVNVVAPPPATYSSSEIETARQTACTAWDRAARSTALASKSSAQALEQSWTSPESLAALATEKRSGMAAVSYMRTQLSAATPASTAIPLHDWMAANIDMLHALNMRHWDEADREQKRGNDLIDVITSECRLR